MKPKDEPTPSNDEPVGAAETLLGIGELIAAVFAMQPNSGGHPHDSQREPAPICDHGGTLDPSATRTLSDTLTEYNDRDRAK